MKTQFNISTYVMLVRYASEHNMSIDEAIDFFCADGLSEPKKEKK